METCSFCTTEVPYTSLSYNYPSDMGALCPTCLEDEVWR